MPKLVQTYQKYKDQGLETVAVAMDYDPPNYVLAYSQKHQLPFPVALDMSGDLAKAFKDVSSSDLRYRQAGKILQRITGDPDMPRQLSNREELKEST
jgi:peroxiredoxin